jgi:hypothetical protein
MWYKFASDFDRSVVSLDTPVSSNKTDRHDINEILLKVALNSISLNFNVIKHSLETTSS